MSATRWPFGIALGRYGTVGPTSSSYLLPVQDATPNVDFGSYLVTANTTAVTVTDFDGTIAGGLDGAEEGKVLILHFRDNVTTLANAGNLYLAASGGVFTSGSLISLVRFNSAWYELCRSQNTRDVVKTVTVAGTVAPDVTLTQVLLVNATATTTIIGLSGGVPGQQVLVLKAAAAAGTSLTIQGATNFWLAGTTAFVSNDSAAYRFVCDAGVRFRQLGGPIVP